MKKLLFLSLALVFSFAGYGQISQATKLIAGTNITLNQAGNTYTVNAAGAAALGAWALTGNTLGADTKWLGSIDNFNIGFKTNNTLRETILKSGEHIWGPGTTLSGTEFYSFQGGDVYVDDNFLVNNAITTSTRTLFGGAWIATAGMTFGVASTTNGVLIFKNSTNANTLTINSGVTSSSHSWTLPLTQGAASSFLQNNGSGVLSWASATPTLTVGSTAIASGTAGALLFEGAGNVLQEDATQLFWDNTNNRLGVGIATPTVTIHGVGTTTTVAVSALVIQNSSFMDLFRIRNSGQIHAGDGTNFNVFVGINSGLLVDQTGGGSNGRYNTSLGNVTLSANTTGYYNTAIGSGALRDNTIGLENVSIGGDAMMRSTTADLCTAVGVDALYQLTTGDNNTAVGDRALENLTTGANNSALGVGAGRLHTGGQSIFIGFEAGKNMSSGNDNTVLGYQAAYAPSTAQGITALGYTTLQNNTADYNVAVGYQALTLNTSGARNVAMGKNALQGNTNQDDNVAIGFTALGSYTATAVGGKNVAIGSEALNASRTGRYNVAVGFRSMYNATTGEENTAIGKEAMLLATTANDNVAVGQTALSALVSGYYNTAVGINALALTTGKENTALGYEAGHTNVGSGSEVFGSVFLGAFAGYYETGNAKLFIDNAKRTDEATARISALIYGEYNATVANQIFRVNGQIQGTQMHNNANAPTGTTYNYIASGTYTATITDSANTSARTAYRSTWTRVGNVVHVAGVVDVDPTVTLTATMIKISLPIVSNFSIIGECRGTATAESIASQSAAIVETTAYATADFAVMKWISTDVTNQPMSYEFQYEVK